MKPYINVLRFIMYNKFFISHDYEIKHNCFMNMEEIVFDISFAIDNLEVIYFKLNLQHGMIE